MEQHWFTAKEVCSRLGMEVRTFRTYIDQGVFPKGVKRGARTRVWDAEDLVAMMWIEKNRHRMKKKVIAAERNKIAD